MTGAPASVGPAWTGREELARFLTQSNHHTSGRVSARAFTLPKNETQLSIFWSEGLSEAERWLLADEQLQVRPAIGAALFTPDVVGRAGLHLDRDGTDHPRHASLGGWPTEKDAQKECASVIAAEATLRLR